MLFLLVIIAKLPDVRTRKILWIYKFFGTRQIPMHGPVLSISTWTLGQSSDFPATIVSVEQS